MRIERRSGLRTAHVGGVALLCLGIAGQAGVQGNDDFARRFPLSGPSGRIQGSNVGATREPGEPLHAGVDGSTSIWYTWTAPGNGTATFHTNGSTFDTLLGVYTGNNVGFLRGVASDDDSGEFFESHVYFQVSTGLQYNIAVDGWGGEEGSASLSWSFAPPCAPAVPFAPFPADQAGEVFLTGLNLRWNGGTGVRAKTIYGRDDRQDFYEVTDPGVLSVWDSTVALVYRDDLSDNGDGTYSLPATTYGQSFLPFVFCPGERYVNQPNPAWCSGFLVGSDLVATAGHCMPNTQECAGTAFVFGFRMLGVTQPVLTFPKSQVYFCKEVVDSRIPENLADWAIVRLDRKVPDHKPLTIRRDGKVPNGEPLFCIGHPAGLPAKVSPSGRVEDNSPPDHFVTRVDVYGGNSGSAVFSALTLMVEGILVAGEFDYEDQGNCFASKVCPEGGCMGEIITRATEFDHWIPPNPDRQVHEVRFGPCGALELLGETQEPVWPLPPLAEDTTYCWQIRSRGECGTVEGPVWSFRTAGAPPPPTGVLRRGDANDDGGVDLGDAVAVLFHLFNGLELSCERSADFDDNSEVVLEDAIGLLNYLYLDGPQPRAPFPSCGRDTTLDRLSCPGQSSCR